MKSEGSPLPLYLGIPPQPSDLSSHTPASGNTSLALNAKPPGYVSHGTFLYNLIFARLVSVCQTQAP